MQNPLIIPKSPAPPLVLPISHPYGAVLNCRKAWGELSYDDKGLYVRLCACETPLLANAGEDGGTVWEDSCLELFIRPDNDERYINFEMNPLGAMVIGLGPGRQEREDLLSIKPSLRLSVTIIPSGGFWYASFKVPFAVLREVYGRDAGKVFWANLYKCGGTDGHYIMWREVPVKPIDFHRPEYFGQLALQ
jgi:hypothetical protein